MPRTTNNSKSNKRTKVSMSKQSDDENFNENHSTEMVVKKKKMVKPETKVKSKVTKVIKAKQNRLIEQSEDKLDYEYDEELSTQETVLFNEDDNLIEIAFRNDGKSDFPSDDKQDITSEESDLEDGEVDSEVEQFDKDIDDQMSEEDKWNKSMVGKTKTKVNSTKKKQNRCSLEDKLDDVTSTLKVMQEFMIKKGLFEDNEASWDTSQVVKSKQNKDKTGEINPEGESSQSGSETTIYQEAVLQDQSNKMEVDSEITFNLINQKVNTDSMSSEEQMDTSDELADLNVDKFIAECQKDARQRSHEREPLCAEERQDFRMGQS